MKSAITRSVSGIGQWVANYILRPTPVMSDYAMRDLGITNGTTANQHTNTYSPFTFPRC